MARDGTVHMASPCSGSWGRSFQAAVVVVMFAEWCGSGAGVDH